MKKMTTLEQLKSTAEQAKELSAQVARAASDAVEELDTNKQDKAAAVGRSMAEKTVEPTAGTETAAGLGAEIFNRYDERTYNADGTPASGNVAAGQYSHAEGSRTSAAGGSSHAEGVGTLASGNSSHTEGNSTTASGAASHAEGGGTRASGSASHAEGSNSRASGANAHAEGIGTVASGDNAHAEGRLSAAYGAQTHAEGRCTTASGLCGHVEGEWSVSIGRDSHAEGGMTVAAYADDVLKIKGYNVSAKTFTFDNTYTGFSAAFAHLAPSSKLVVVNDQYYSTGFSCTVDSVNTANHSVTVVEALSSSGFAPTYAVIIGVDHGNSVASNHAEGNDTIATGSCAHAEGSGSIATGNCAHAEGNYTTAEGEASHAGGAFTIAGAKYQTVIGTYNVRSTSASDRLIIGKGASSARANCFRVTDTGVYASGAHNASGADYAELFEWMDGNPKAEDRCGLFVTLEGEKIRLAGPEDGFVLGIISGSPSVVGDVYDDQWQGTYLRDVFGRPLWEDVVIPEETAEEPDPEDPEKTADRVICPARIERRQKLNPDFDGAQAYVPRSQRPEWGCVGLMGKLVVADDGSCQADGWCAPGQGGAATRSETRTDWRVLARIDGTHVRVLALARR